ncbi:MAG: hypothetical protein ACPHF3_12050 [Pseudomonadales bacterium]
MNRIFVSAFLVVTVALISGCGDDPGFDKFAPSPSASIKVINAVSDSPPLYTEFGTQTIGNAAFGEASDITSIIPDLARTTTVSYIKDNRLENIADFLVTVPLNGLKTLFLTGTMDNLQLVEVLAPPPDPAVIETTLTLVHAASAYDQAITFFLEDIANNEARKILETVQPGSASTAIVITPSEKSILSAEDEDGNRVYTSREFIITEGVSPTIALIDSFGPSESPVTGIYNVNAGTTAFPDTTFNASVRVLNAIPDRTSIDVYQRSVTSSNPPIVSLLAEPTAKTGTFEVTVERLAVSETYQTLAAFESGTAEVGTGTLTITNGTNSVELTIDSANATAEGIVSAISGSEADIAAVLIEDSEGLFRLLLSTLDFKQSNQTEISVSDDDGNNADAAGLSQISSTQLEIVTEALSAQFTVNGASEEASSNAVTELVEDVTFFLISAPTDPTTVTLEITPQILIAEDLLFGDISEYRSSATGNVIFTATDADNLETPIYSEALNLADNRYHMLAITGLGADLDAAIANEEKRPVKTLSSLAILHAAPSTPLLDVYVLPSSTTISDSDPTGNNIVPLLTGQFGLLPDTFTISVTESSSETVIGGPLTIDAVPYSLFKIVLLDAPGGGAPIQVLTVAP